MTPFTYKNRRLFAENVDVSVIAERMGTPCYIYSRAKIEERWCAFDNAFSGLDHLVCFAVKANSNIAVLNLLARLGSGFDIVSGGELERVVLAGGDPGKVVFSGVGKTALEMRRALGVGIFCFNVESAPELEMLNRVAGELGLQAPIALRVNPDIDPNTHPYIATGLKDSKFGVDIREAVSLYREAKAMPNIEPRGIAGHIGSQLTQVEPFVDVMDRLADLVGELLDEGIALSHVDIGGGLGIRYKDEQVPEPDDFALALRARLQSRGSHYQNLRLLIEPGRAIVGNAGLLLTRVLYLKHGEELNFAIVDAAMNDLIRPALYGAWHDIAPVSVEKPRQVRIYDVVGPICESGDFLGNDRELGIEPDDLLVVASAGAYGWSMSSNYNSRPRCSEVVVDGDQIHIVRRRESIEELTAPEAMLPSE
jgi:diaminopimelate decarboxylase